MMDAVGLNNGVLKEVENFIRSNTCVTIAEKVDHDHTNALIDFVMEQYMNVNLHLKFSCYIFCYGF